ncbi:MAG TPA: cadherin repeat domain-containing protein, partial [Lachnospiraceae bacterium]|nr:cadherin repeat domain-containing protein [Lachnospiraceae bacterium]
AFAVTANTAYLDSNGIMQTVNATVLDSSVTTLTSGWYVAKGTVSTGKITISGDVKLILADGASLTATSNTINNAGICVTTSNSLTIYGQTNGTGKLSTKGGTCGAGIGGNLGDTSGTINIYGGTVEAMSQSAAGIGGGVNGYAGTINIYGGIVRASSSDSGAGIGNGYGASFGSSSGIVNIYGGTITAASKIGAGIGGGSDISAGTVHIYGGTVTAKATSTDFGQVGIGNGYPCYISGGSVNASRISPAPTNGSVNGGATVYRTIVTLNDINTVTKVTSLTKSASYYSTKGLCTDDSGKLYLWLPAGANVSAATTAESGAAGGSYIGTVTTTSSGTTYGSLTWNRQPTDISLSSTSLAENIALGSTCGTLNTTDVNTGDTFTYSLVSGAGDTDNAAFSISDQNLKLNVIPDYETKSSYNIRLRSTDASGLYYEKAFTITIININEAPTISVPATLSVPMDSTTDITGMLFTDVDAGSGSVAAKFSVTSGTLAATSGMGVTAASSKSTELTLTGSISNINSFLDAGNLSFTSDLGSHAPVTLSVTLNDSGNSGSGGARTVSKSVSISILYPATVNSVSVPNNGSYKAGDFLDFIVDFSKAVSVDTSGGTPYLPLTIGGKHSACRLFVW